MSETVEVCPECGSTNLRNTVGHYLGNNANHDGHTCNNCEATFQEPKVREKKHNQKTRSGLAGKLAEPDVEDVDDLVTDGGRNYSDTQFMNTNNDWHDCDACGASYRSRAPAVRCCDGFFGGIEQ